MVNFSEMKGYQLLEYFYLHQGRTMLVSYLICLEAGFPSYCVSLIIRRRIGRIC